MYNPLLKYKAFFIYFLKRILAVIKGKGKKTNKILIFIIKINKYFFLFHLYLYLFIFIYFSIKSKLFNLFFAKYKMFNFNVNV